MHFRRSRTYNKIEAFILLIVFIFLIPGYFMNFQNLWEYWPVSSQFSDVPMQWILSIVGIFIAPLGATVGWIF